MKRSTGFSKKWRKRESSGFNEVLTTAEIDAREHLSGDFTSCLKAMATTSFSDDCLRPAIKPYDVTDYRFGRATHGYNPDLGPQPVFNAIGPDFRRQVVIDGRPIVDEPDIRQVLGLKCRAKESPSNNSCWGPC